MCLIPQTAADDSGDVVSNSVPRGDCAQVSVGRIAWLQPVLRMSDTRAQLLSAPE